ncbi:MAG: DNA primase [Nanohaloarchaea archaeon]|nr:DNA primase [Candidatus Nanohaloarchaea archaeon]
MGKLAQTSVKYLITAEFEAEGTVEKPDVIGALFGQSEGLLGHELDLRELQRTGRIGRIDVDVITSKGKSKGKITIPSSLDSTETALIAATIETIERVGPCDAKLYCKSIEDIRAVKRKQIIDRSKILLRELMKDVPEISTLAEELMESVRSADITNYKGNPAGPDVETGDSIIVCEGRADVLVLLKHGIKNAIAIGGTGVPPVIAQLTKSKETTAFLDGDRGGDLIFKELVQVGEIDFMARAPFGKEVEELTKKEIFKALREKVPAEQAVDLAPIRGKGKTKGKTFDRRAKKPVDNVTTVRIISSSKKSSDTRDKKPSRDRPEKSRDRPSRAVSAAAATKKDDLSKDQKKVYAEQLNELIGTHAASIYDKKNNFAGRVPVKNLESALKQVAEPLTVIVDGEVDKKLCKIVEDAGAENIIATKVKDKVGKVNVFIQENL